MSVSKRYAVMGWALGGGLIFAAATGFSLWRAEIASRPVVKCSLQFPNASITDVPQVTTRAQMERGLSGLDDVGPGMLFSWPDDDYRFFWMKGTSVPLSIAFIDSQGVVVQIKDMEPHSEHLRRSKVPAREALEVKRGDFQKLGVGVGSRIVSRQCHGQQ